jgi:predicted nucleotidyltransferase
MNLEKLKNLLLEYDFIEFALIFGSYADGSEHNLSDIDIALYTTKEIDLLTQGYIVATLESEFNKTIDLVIINNLFKTNPKLSFNITDKHKVIFCKDEKSYIDFKTYSLKYYFDTAYMYDIFDKELKNRLNNGTYGKITTY